MKNDSANNDAKKKAAKKRRRMAKKQKEKGPPLPGAVEVFFRPLKTIIILSPLFYFGNSNGLFLFTSFESRVEEEDTPPSIVNDPTPSDHEIDVDSDMGINMILFTVKIQR